MEKAICKTCVMACFAALLIPGSSARATPILTVESTTVEPGDDFVVDVTADSVTDLFGYQFAFIVTPQGGAVPGVLHYVSGTDAIFAGKGFSAGSPSQKMFAHTLTNTADVVSGTGLTVATFTFSCDSAAVPGDTYELSLAAETYLLDTAHTSSPGLDKDTVSGTVEVVPEPATMAMIGLGGVALLRRRR